MRLFVQAGEQVNHIAFLDYVFALFSDGDISLERPSSYIKNLCNEIKPF